MNPTRTGGTSTSECRIPTPGGEHPQQRAATPAFLFESNWNVDGHHVVFGRAEYVRKTGTDLVLSPELADRAFNAGMIALGYVYDFGPFARIVPGLGVRGTVDVVEDGLEPFYGQRVPLGVMLFLELRPAAMPM